MRLRRNGHMETREEKPDVAATTPDEPPANTAARERIERALLLAAEIGLVLAILGLLLAIWLPALVGPHPGAARF